MAYLGENIPKLGFGLMRLPMIGEEVDLEQTKQMVDLFLEKGFRYFDTAYGYLGGKSEEAVKTALVDRYPRDRFYLATKLPAWAGANTAQEAKDMFYTSLKRTGAGYFDFYLLHNLGADRTHFFDDYELWDFVQERKAEGLIKHIGFSFHDKAAVLDEILTKHPEVEFVQLQINYIDWDSESIESGKCYEVARKHNKPIVVMEPVKGGNLAVLPENVTKILKDYAPEASLPSWAIRFVASHDGLITVLSGMSTLEQMKDNLSYMEEFKPLSDEENGVLSQAVSALNAIPKIPCTGCHYCTKGCPMSIDIPEIFTALNIDSVFENFAAAKGKYGWAIHNGPKASDCVECGQCVSVCPQHILIPEELKKAVRKFE